MGYRFNRIKRGAWYIYRESDLLAIHKIFLDFYNRVLVPMFGDLKKFVFIYDLKANRVKIRQCMHLGEIKINLIRESEFAKELYLLLDTIAATGIVSAPFYLIEIKFNPSQPIQKKGNILTFKGGRGGVTGYYHLRGILA